MGCILPVPAPPPRDGREETPDVVRGLYTALVDEVTVSGNSSLSPFPSSSSSTSSSSTSSSSPFSPISPASPTLLSSPTSPTTPVTPSSRASTGSRLPSTPTGNRSPFESKHLTLLPRPRAAEEAAGTEWTPEESEYLWVKSLFDNSGGDHYTILKMERIQNPKLAKAYNVKKQSLETQGALDERWLFHGTTRSAAANIVQNNFDMNKIGKHWNVYGKGFYFSPAASYSCFFSSFAQLSRTTNYAYYTNQVVREGVPLQVILARVLVGKPIRGYQGMKELPEGYHSACDDPAQPWIYVLFENAQILPSYVITFVK